MSAIFTKFNAIMREMAELQQMIAKMPSESPATTPKEEKPVASTPTPTNAPTGTGAPANHTAKVSLLVDTAIAEARKLEAAGENVDEILAGLSLVLRTNRKTAKNAAHSILDLLRPMSERIDVSALWHAVQRIEGELDDSTTGIIGDTDVTGDMTGVVG